MYNAEGGDNGGPDNISGRGGRGGRSEPRGAIRGGRDGDEFASRSPRAPRGDYGRPAAAPRDPFFDKPYEPSEAPTAPPSWEASAKPATRSISANIKPKRKVAALFKSE
jgi:hypothetical protein